MRKKGIIVSIFLLLVFAAVCNIYAARAWYDCDVLRCGTTKSDGGRVYLLCGNTNFAAGGELYFYIESTNSYVQNLANRALATALTCVSADKQLRSYVDKAVNWQEITVLYLKND